MDKFVLSLCGLWFWLTRKYRTTLYSHAAGSLNSACDYLTSDFYNRASTRDRGFLLPHQAEALAILQRHAGLVAATSRRFSSLVECCKFVTEELAEPQAIPETPLIPASQRVVFPPSATATAKGAAEPAPVLASFAAFWSSEGVGTPGRFRPTAFSHATIVRAFTRGGDSRSHLPASPSEISSLPKPSF
jgi:hypothetical protein